MQIIEKTYKWSGKLENRSSTKRIILHHAEAKSCTAADIHRWHLDNGWSGIGYHFFVRKDGTVYRGRPEDAVGAHAYGANSDSIGICFEGNFEQEIMPEVQAKSGYELVKMLKARYNISKVQAHRDVGSTNCPGKNFPIKMVSTGDGLEQESPDPVDSKISISVRQLCENHRGGDVKALQSVLNATGYSCGTADGIFGSKTTKAVKKFQAASKLTADGVVGKKTWEKLLKM